MTAVDIVAMMEKANTRKFGERYVRGMQMQSEQEKILETLKRHADTYDPSASFVPEEVVTSSPKSGGKSAKVREGGRRDEGEKRGKRERETRERRLKID